MKKTKIITMKIEPEIFADVKAGKKRIEVRDEPMNDVDLIRYIDATRPDMTLGYAQLLGTARLSSYQSSKAFTEIVADIAHVDADTAERLFDGKRTLFLGLIGKWGFGIESLLDDEEGIE